jgi:hypothetical protein
MISIHLEFSTIAEAAAFMAAGAGVTNATTDTAKPTKADTKPKAEAKPDPKPEVKAEETKPTGPKREDVSAKVVMLATKSVDAATAVLSKFGVAKARELKDEDLAEALKATEAALAQLDMA